MPTPSEIRQQALRPGDAGPTGRVARLAAAILGYPAWTIVTVITATMSVFLFLLLGQAWFYFDDFEFLQDAHSGGLSLETLFRPIAGHVLPITRVLTWVVLLPGEPSWTIARLIIVALFVASCWSLWWALGVFFGDDNKKLIPFILFATSATVGVFSSWWCSAIQEFMLAITLFQSVGWGVRYLRERKLGSLVITYAWWALGMLAFEKSMVILIVIPAIALAYFSSGNLWQRIRLLWSDFKLAMVSAFLLALTVTVAYVWYVPEGSDTKLEPGLIGPLLDVMLGRTLWPMLAGGPLRWNNETGAVVADPPAIYFNVILVVVVVTFGFLALRRRRVGRAVALVGVVFAFAFTLLLITRATDMGATLGHLFRYQGEVFMVTILALGLSLMPLIGATESSEDRAEPVLQFSPGPQHLLPTIILLVGLSLVSSLTYFNSWKTFPQRAEKYLANLEKGVRRSPTAVIAGGNVPNDLLWAVHGPYTRVGNLIEPFNIPARFDQPTTKLQVIDNEGRVVPATVSARGQTQLGPDPDCGWRVSDREPVTLPMENRMIPWVWWSRIGYMAGTRTQVRVTAGSQSFQKTLPSGLGTLYFPTDGDFAAIRVEVLSQGNVICLDRAVIGDAVPVNQTQTAEGTG
ncbi:MAG TPA: hypothetical protein PLC19_01645 [Marmoricola sp.]|nr:hypothetical protein [Marmoricola sp.]